MKFLESTRIVLEKKKKSTRGRSLSKTKKPIIVRKNQRNFIKSTSFQTDASIIDLTNIDCGDIFKTSDTSKLGSTATIVSKNLNFSKDVQVDFDKSLNSPLQKKNPIILEKTPAFQYFSVGHQKNVDPSNKRKPLIATHEKLTRKDEIEQCRNLLEKITKCQEKEIFEDSEKDELVMMEQDCLMKLKMKELNSENERKLKYLEDHISKLSKDNERMCAMINDQKAIEEVKKTRNLLETPTDILLDSNRAFITLTQAYEEMKKENRRLAELSKSAYCGKCKVFIETDSELVNKISRLRAYLSND